MIPRCFLLCAAVSHQARGLFGVVVNVSTLGAFTSLSTTPASLSDVVSDVRYHDNATFLFAGIYHNHWGCCCDEVFT